MNIENHDVYKYVDNQIIRLTNTVYNESYPSSSPDGKSFAFITDESGINNIYITEDDFETAHPITNILTGTPNSAAGIIKIVEKFIAFEIDWRNAHAKLKSSLL